jgi:hypothetical protein
MRTNTSKKDLEGRAEVALRALLSEVSVIKLKDIRREAQTAGSGISMVVHAEVLGHSHTLACEVQSSAKPASLRSALRKLRDGAAQIDEGAMPVIIARHLSPEAQALCKESHAGFLDFEGNARIAVGEVFIGKRSIPPRVAHPSIASSVQAA